MPIRAEIGRFTYWHVICDRCGRQASKGLSLRDAEGIAFEKGFRITRRWNGVFLERHILCSGCAGEDG